MGSSLGTQEKLHKKMPRKSRPELDPDKLIKSKIQSALYEEKHPFADLPY